MNNKVLQKAINLQPEYLNINISEDNNNDFLLHLEDSIEEQNQFRNLFYPFDLYLYKEVYLDENYDIIEEREYEENGGQRNSKLS